MGGPLGRRLLAEGIITPEALQHGLAEESRTNDRLGPILVRLGYVGEDQLVDVLSRTHRISAIGGAEVPIEPEVLRLVPARIARKYDVIPVERGDGTLVLAMADPTNLPALDDVAFLTGLRVVPTVARLSAVRRAIEHAYGDDEGLAEAQADAYEIEIADAQELADPVDHADLRSSVDQAPVIRLVNAILLEAIRRSASDVHLEPSDTFFRIRFRIDGVLHDGRTLPKRLETVVMSRIKVMARLDIAERRLPQDGRFKLRCDGREVDFRVNILPAVSGESLSMRILDSRAIRTDLAHLGFDGWGLEQLHTALQKTSGLILITGPTGSGKTTTLYAALHNLDAKSLNIVTVEDPVEYKIERITQVAVHEEIGRSFASVLRSFLRHDPDAILVGEMRDLETVQVAIRAALTGHLVLSTLHTNDAPSTIARLRDMEIPPFLQASALRLIVAQRLARKICVACREPYETDAESLVPYGHRARSRGTCTLYKGRGCKTCNFSGTKGRIGLYEVMPVTEEIRELIWGGAPIRQIREAARHNGMTTLQEAGLLKALDGVVTIDEVLRVTSE